MRNKVLYHITKQRKWLPLIAIMLTLGTIVWVVVSNHCEFSEINKDNWWVKWGDPIIGLSTFFVAVVIWLMNSAKYWEDRLDKKLTVVYMYDGRMVINIENAFLAHEGDIRNWGQQLGTQAIKTENYRFKLDSNIALDKPEVKNDKSTYYKHYSVTFTLTKLPPPYSDKEDLKFGHIHWKENGEIIFNKDDSIKGEPRTAKISFSSKDVSNFHLVFFEVNNLLPEDLKTITPPDAVAGDFAHKGVILSGRGPIWLYGFLIHFYHPTKWVATFDPRLRGAVVVESHTSEIKVGDIVPLEI